MKESLDIQDDRSYFIAMSKREDKKDHLLDSGLEVMKSQGYNGTSVKDIVEAAGVPKGSFYNYFESKEVFAIEALEKTALEGFKQAQVELTLSQNPPLERLAAFFTSNTDNACDGKFKVGCFLGNMCQEMADSSEDIRLKIKYLLRQHTLLIESVLKQAQADGEISNSTDTSVMAEFIFNAWQGSLMRMKASKCREPLDAFLQILPGLLKS